MPLSTEAILSLIGVFVNLPPALFIAWKLYSRRRRDDVDPLGRDDEDIPHLTKADDYDYPQMSMGLSSIENPEPIWSGQGGLLLPSKARHRSRLLSLGQALGSPYIKHCWVCFSLFEWVIGGVFGLLDLDQYQGLATDLFRMHHSF